jgi:diacylglycerol O-acyltransferase / wax synthase
MGGRIASLGALRLSGHHGVTAGRVDRVSAADIMQLTSDVGPVPMQIGACLMLDASGFDPVMFQRHIAARVLAVPRMRQVLVRTPPGCGRPVWVDDPAFDVRDHVRQQRCPPPGDEQALLDLVADAVTARLPMSRPLWAAIIVTGLTGHAAALIVVLHHVLADGIGGLAVLASLADGAGAPPGGVTVPPPPPGGIPAPPPSPGALAADAWAGRLLGLRRLPHARGVIRRSAAELGGRVPARAPRCSLNRPTGPRRRIAVVTADLDRVRALAHRHGGTVNDVMLAAIAGSLGRLLASRGEPLPELVVSVPVSARASATTRQLGNQAGVMPVTIPTGGDLRDRLERTAAVTRARKGPAPGASAVLLSAAFRLLAWSGMFGWFINHQHLVHTFITNVRGPAQRLRVGGATVSAVIPVTVATGNVTVSFGVLSYAGTLALTVIADPAQLPDLAVLTSALGQELAGCTGGTHPP